MRYEMFKTAPGTQVPFIDNIDNKKKTSKKAGGYIQELFNGKRQLKFLCG
jgi:hypothetical protein